MTSATFTHEAQADTSSDPILVLLTITHADLGAPLRFVANTVDVVSRGNTFTAYGFGFAAPGDGESGATSARIVIDNIDRRIVDTIRALSTPPEILVEIVLGSNPDVVEETFPPFEVRSANGDRLAIQADLTDMDDDGQAAMRWTFVPSLAPALFR